MSIISHPGAISSLPRSLIYELETISDADTEGRSCEREGQAMRCVHGKGCTAAPYGVFRDLRGEVYVCFRRQHLCVGISSRQVKDLVPKKSSQAIKEISGSKCQLTKHRTWFDTVKSNHSTLD